MRPPPSLGRTEIREVLRRGLRTTTDGVTLAVLARPGHSGLGLSVRAPGGVVRNRVKRRLRAAAAAAELRDVLVVARAERGVVSASFQELVTLFRGANGGRA